MEKKTTRTITSETHELLIVRVPSGHAIRMWCSECDTEVDMLRPDEAAVLASVSTRRIYQWVEADQIHYQESTGGNVVICPNQVFNNAS